MRVRIPGACTCGPGYVSACVRKCVCWPASVSVCECVQVRAECVRECVNF